ncbi:hypothetical protein V8C86DRAFT_3142240, partial [Haematococcus lacustris]
MAGQEAEGLCGQARPGACHPPLLWRGPLPHIPPRPSSTCWRDSRDSTSSSSSTCGCAAAPHRHGVWGTSFPSTDPLMATPLPRHGGGAGPTCLQAASPRGHLLLLTGLQGVDSLRGSGSS